MASEPARAVAIYPGSFDPITNGHLDLIERGRRLFEHLVVAVLHNEAKQPLFTVEERMEMLREVVGRFPNVEVDCFDGLLVNYARPSRRAGDPARYSRDIGLRVRIADGFDEPAACDPRSKRFPDGGRGAFVRQLAAGERSRPVRRRYRRLGAAPVADRRKRDSDRKTSKTKS